MNSGRSIWDQQKRAYFLTFLVGLTGWGLVVLGGIWGIGSQAADRVSLVMMMIFVGILLIVTGSILYITSEIQRVTKPRKTIPSKGFPFFSVVIGIGGWVVIMTGPILAAVLEPARALSALILAVLVGSALVILGATMFGLREIRVLAEVPLNLSFPEKFWLEVAGLGWLFYLIIPVYGILTRAIGGMPYFYGGLMAGMGLYLLGTGGFLFLTLRPALHRLIRQIFGG